MAQHYAGFEFHLILNSYEALKAGVWYLVRSRNQPMSPATRVGAAAIFVPHFGRRGKLLHSGGSDKEGAYGDLRELRTNKEYFRWSLLRSEGMVGRYEHAIFLLDGALYCFGGAEEKGPLNDLLKYNSKSGVWVAVETTGPTPSPRTCHYSGTTAVVYSGGYKDINPVDDTEIYFFNAARSEWSAPPTSGVPPCPRQGHAMAVVGRRLFLHGGMAGSQFLDDLHVLNLDTYEWSQPEVSGISPGAVAAHSSVAIGNKIYFFGGLCAADEKELASRSLHFLDTDAMTWGKALYSTEANDPPTPRIDVAMCTVRIPVIREPPKDDYKSSSDEENEAEAESLTEEASKESASASSGPPNLEVTGVPLPLVALATSDTEATAAAATAVPNILTVIDPSSSENFTPISECNPESFSEVPLTPGQDLYVSIDEDAWNGEYVTGLFVHGGFNSVGEIFSDSFVYIPQD